MNTFKIYTANLPSLDTDMTGYLTRLFAHDSANYNQLKYEIQREYRFSGSPQVTSMKFDRVQYNSDSGKGSFRVILDINFTFGCEDVTTEKANQTSEWTFNVDPQSAVIHFYGSPFIDSRSTVDEF
jgi:hypothetical protein